MIDYTHLDALEYRLHNETMRLNNVKTDGERSMRAVWVDQIKKEIADEKKFLGIDDIDRLHFDLNDYDLLAAILE